MFTSGNINLTTKFHGENFNMDGLLNRLGMEALLGIDITVVFLNWSEVVVVVF